VVRSRSDVTADVAKRHQFLRVEGRRSASVDQRFSFLVVVVEARMRSGRMLLSLAKSASSFDRGGETASESVPPGRQSRRNGRASTANGPAVDVCLAPRDRLRFGEVARGGVVDAVVGADWAAQPFSNYVPLDVVENCAARAQRDERVVECERPQRRLVTKQQLSHSLVVDERLVGWVDNARQVDAHQQNVS